MVVPWFVVIQMDQLVVGCCERSESVVLVQTNVRGVTCYGTGRGEVELDFEPRVSDDVAAMACCVSTSRTDV